MRRVLVTGIGTVTPLGNDARSTWETLLTGASGIGPISLFDTSEFEGAIAGEVKDFRPEESLPAKSLRHMDRHVAMACVASMEAVTDAGLEVPEGGLGPKAGVVFSAGSGGYSLLDKQRQVLAEKGPRRVSPFFLANILPDASSGHVAILTGATGPNMAVVSACATGTSSIGEAAEIIRRGDAEVMIAGGAEAPLTPILYAGFNALRAIASPGDNPAEACKPFDRRRDGFVIAEGAGALVLESQDHAKARGVTPYAEVSGYGASNDAFDMVGSEDSGRGPILAIEMALRKAGIDSSQVGYVNAHGTGTPMNDRVETGALKRIFGPHAYKFAVSSTKAVTGHLMGAAGAVEAAISVLALRHSTVPPTMHYKERDPDCDLDYVPNQARELKGLQAVLSSSIGLGGHNSALVLSQP